MLLLLLAPFLTCVQQIHCYIQNLCHFFVLVALSACCLLIRCCSCCCRRCRRRRRKSTWFTRCCDNYFQYSHLFLVFLFFVDILLITTNFFESCIYRNSTAQKKRDAKIKPRHSTTCNAVQDCFCFVTLLHHDR